MRRKYRGSKQPGYHSGVKRDRRIRMRLPFAEIMVNHFSPIFGPEKKERLSSLSLSPRHSSREKGAATRLTLPWFPARFTEFPQTSPVLSLFPLPECISLRLARFDARHASPHCPRFVLLRETTIKRRHASRTRNINHRFSNEISFRPPSAAVPTCHFASLRIFNE